MPPTLPPLQALNTAGPALGTCLALSSSLRCLSLHGTILDSKCSEAMAQQLSLAAAAARDADEVAAESHRPEPPAAHSDDAPATTAAHMQAHSSAAPILGSGSGSGSRSTASVIGSGSGSGSRTASHGPRSRGPSAAPAAAHLHLDPPGLTALSLESCGLYASHAPGLRDTLVGLPALTSLVLDNNPLDAQVSNRRGGDYEGCGWERPPEPWALATHGLLPLALSPKPKPFKIFATLTSLVLDGNPCYALVVHVMGVGGRVPPSRLPM